MQQELVELASHLEEYVQAHILFSFLPHAMWKTLEQWMARCGPGNDPHAVIEELERIKTNIDAGWKPTCSTASSSF